MSGGTSSTSSWFGQLLGQHANKLFKQADPAMNALMQNLMSVLQGNVFGGGTMPLAQRAVSASRQAAGQAMTGAESYLAKTGVANSPFAAAIMSQIQQQGQESVANAPIGVAENMLGLGTKAMMGGLGTAFSGLGQAGALNSSSSSKGFDLGQLIQAGGQLGAAALL